MGGGGGGGGGSFYPSNTLAWNLKAQKKAIFLWRNNKG